MHHGVAAGTRGAPAPAAPGLRAMPRSDEAVLRYPSGLLSGLASPAGHES